MFLPVWISFLLPLPIGLCGCFVDVVFGAKLTDFVEAGNHQKKET